MNWVIQQMKIIHPHNRYSVPVSLKRFLARLIIPVMIARLSDSVIGFGSVCILVELICVDYLFARDKKYSVDALPHAGCSAV